MVAHFESGVVMVGGDCVYMYFQSKLVTKDSKCCHLAMDLSWGRGRGSSFKQKNLVPA